MSPSLLNPTKSKIFTGTKTVLTNQARNEIHNVHLINREAIEPNKLSFQQLQLLKQTVANSNKTEAIAEQAVRLFENIQRGTSNEMGDVDYERQVIDPYNPKIKKKSLVDFRDRYRLHTKIYPKRKVNFSFLDKMRKKVRVYVYKDENGATVAVKQEHMPKQPYLYGPKG